MTNTLAVACLVLLRATTAHALAASTPTAAHPPIPLTQLSGIQVAGKTTVLTHLLNNQQDAKIGVVVNDVAAVNIDAKLVSNADDAAWADNVVQLSNGCACCTGGDDLFASLAELVSLSFMKGEPYDHIVVEASGVAEPKLIRAMFQEAAANSWPLMSYVSLQNMVTVVDSPSFLEEYQSTQRLGERPDLVGGDEFTPQVEPLGVSELLVEMAETADVLLLNKADLASAEQLRDVEELLASINGFADIRRTEFGRVPLDQLLVQERTAGVATSNEVMDHKSSVDWANWAKSQEWKEPPAAVAESDAHDHSHHDHSHSGAPAACSDPACDDPTHDHSHHDHSHSGAPAACSDPACDDPTHDHSHGGDRQQTTAADRFGIRTFVYRRRKPFDSIKLAELIGASPFTLGRVAGLPPVADDVDSARASELGAVFDGLVRSKGFVWLDCSEAAAFFWSHAGRRIDLAEMGKWWAAVPRESWPEGYSTAILEDFDGEGGDRRQEIVFIGKGLDEDRVTSILDACLVES